MAETKSKQEVQQVNKAVFRVVEVEDDSAILLVEGWRMRVYFDKEKKEQIREGQMLEVEYTGDLTNIHSVRLQKLK